MGNRYKGLNFFFGFTSILSLFLAFWSIVINWIAELWWWTWDTYVLTVYWIYLEWQYVLYYWNSLELIDFFFKEIWKCCQMNCISKIILVLENILVRKDSMCSGKHRTDHKDLIASSVAVKTDVGDSYLRLDGDIISLPKWVFHRTGSQLV